LELPNLLHSFFSKYSNMKNKRNYLIQSKLQIAIQALIKFTV